MATTRDINDPKGLIHESYRIEGIKAPECRSIFLDWAISHVGDDPSEAIKSLLARYGAEFPDHPMTKVLTDGLGAQSGGVRRGGARGRRRS